ncbi:MAG: TlpA family protein disulfide reductase [Ferruginibacter sp.]|uniref:TlpA family protein disulfide reductase n=1 Tax=Ferruginibacter sp. TaxID=1940288 RepID=UPI002659801E|nr:TlpA family protein disulfide reductase [Ferruginibacter sp.]MDB5278556.1 TlpA family protein disulfide reductase [Ferruginibacter sp.]
MKPYFVLIFLLISLITYGQQQQIDFDSLVSARQKESIGKPFPLFKALLHNKTFTNQDITGKVVFINFWFANCPPCIAELDALNELYKKLKTNKQFEFVSFTYESPKTVQVLAKKYRMQYKIISLTQQECYRLNQNNAFPTSIVLDKNGMIQFISFGGKTDKAAAKKMVLTEYYQQVLKQL